MQLFHVKNVSKNAKNQHAKNGRIDLLFTIIELLRFLYCT